VTFGPDSRTLAITPSDHVILGSKRRNVSTLTPSISDMFTGRRGGLQAGLCCAFSTVICCRNGKFEKLEKEKSRPESKQFLNVAIFSYR